MNPSIGNALACADGPLAFALMHLELDKVWRHCHRVLRAGGMACINIGDAVRTLGTDFRLYPNHARILTAMSALGLRVLPDILWRKQTNAPNKFMGSGMLPAGAYVTYEHEYILILRKGTRRRFNTAAERANRSTSAFFWEERNMWFSDLWTDLKGAGQGLCDRKARTRSAAFPPELAFRLMLMHSVYGDTVLDPFLGTGTTTGAAIAACRNSIGVEWCRELGPAISETVSRAAKEGAARARGRLASHVSFVADRLASGHRFRHKNRFYGFPVMTSHERDIGVYSPVDLKPVSGGRFDASHCLLTGAEPPRPQAPSPQSR
jgi:DNA modification methylase